MCVCVLLVLDPSTGPRLSSSAFGLHLLLLIFLLFLFLLYTQIYIYNLQPHGPPKPSAWARGGHKVTRLAPFLPLTPGGHYLAHAQLSDLTPSLHSWEEEWLLKLPPVQKPSIGAGPERLPQGKSLSLPGEALASVISSAFFPDDSKAHQLLNQTPCALPGLGVSLPLSPISSPAPRLPWARRHQGLGFFTSSL